MALPCSLLILDVEDTPFLTTSLGKSRISGWNNPHGVKGDSQVSANRRPSKRTSSPSSASSAFSGERRKGHELLSHAVRARARIAVAPGHPPELIVPRSSRRKALHDPARLLHLIVYQHRDSCRDRSRARLCVSRSSWPEDRGRLVPGPEGVRVACTAVVPPSWIKFDRVSKAEWRYRISRRISG